MTLVATSCIIGYMSALRSPPIHDIAGIVTTNPRNVVAALISYFERHPGQFNYKCFRSLIAKALDSRLKKELVVDACYRAGSPAGFAQNAAVAGMLCDWAHDRNLSFYRVPYERLEVGGGLSIPVPIDGYVVENGFPSFLWTQPRKSFNPGRRELSIVATCLKHLYGIDDFRDVQLTILDFSAPTGCKDRVLREFGYGDLDLLSHDELGEVLGLFADAFNQLVASGYRKPEQRRTSRPAADPGQTEMKF